MRILVVGGGGREHALVRAIAASPLCETLWCAPGNAGIAGEAECVPLPADALDGLVGFARDHAVDLVVVGPEQPLVLGLVDRLEAAGIRAFGPSAAAARLEGSKAFTKDLCRRYGIPTAAARAFTEPGPAKAYLRGLGTPAVVKADGLAAGKGVVVAATLEEAEAAVDAALGAGSAGGTAAAAAGAAEGAASGERPAPGAGGGSGGGGAFGAAGATILIEECLTGVEVSVFALCDGTHILPFGAAHDYKRAYDGDRGPNTGGMGAVSPTPRLTPNMERRIYAEIIEPTARAMATEGTPYRGVLYAGVMLTEDGPKLLEYNARFGDPECQALLPRLAGDLLPALVAACEGGLDRVALEWRPESAVCVVMANRGYPGAYTKGGVIRGLETASACPGVHIYHAGTSFGADGEVLATGGRVLNVVGVGGEVAEARERVYLGVNYIGWKDQIWRADLGGTT